MTFICRPASVDIWYIHWIFTHKKKQKNKTKQKTTTTTTKKNTKKTSRKKFDVNTTVSRRARWDFRGVFDGSLFLYLKFDMNKYLKNWGNYEVLRIELGGFIVTNFFIYGSFLALQCFCLQFWNFAVLSVLHMPYQSCFWYIFMFEHVPQPYCIPFLFLVYCLPGIAIFA